MKIIEISISNQDVSRLKSLLSELEYIKFVKEKDPASIDSSTYLSEHSLAEEWDSEEDRRYEKFFDK